MLVKRVGSAMALIVAGAFFTSAQAAPISGGEATKRSMADFGEVEQTQIYTFGGRRYCFYDDAWNGPGWYRCGYHWREGFGWGGGPGWHGWSYRHRGHRRPRHTNRRGGRGSEGRRGGRHEGRRDGRGGRDRGSVGRGGRSDGGRGASSGRSSSGGQGSSGGRGGSSSPGSSGSVGGSGRSR